jgi:hypothetical protein
VRIERGDPAARHHAGDGQRMALITVSPVSYAGNPELWDALLRRDPLQYPLAFPLDQEYSRAYAPHISYQDMSMIARVGDQPVAGLQITSHSPPDGPEHIDFYGRPALLRTSREAGAETTGKAERMLAEEFCNLRQSLNSPAFNYLEMCPQGRLSEFAVFLLKSGCAAAPVYKQIIDLQCDEDNLRKDIRKSYRSLINWGEKNLSITVHDHRNTSPEIIEDFRQLHMAVAGKETRSPETWHLQYRQITENEAFLITGRLDGQLVTAALFLHSPSYCYYGVSASLREMFDKPLSHAVLWRSILEAKRRGCRLYEMGDLAHLYPQGYSDKEKNIAVFKRGFGGVALVHLRIGMISDKLHVK